MADENNNDYEMNFYNFNGDGGSYMSSNMIGSATAATDSDNDGYIDLTPTTSSGSHEGYLQVNFNDPVDLSSYSYNSDTGNNTFSRTVSFEGNVVPDGDNNTSYFENEWDSGGGYTSPFISVSLRSATDVNGGSLSRWSSTDDFSQVSSLLYQVYVQNSPENLEGTLYFNFSPETSNEATFIGNHYDRGDSGPGYYTRDNIYSNGSGGDVVGQSTYLGADDNNGGGLKYFNYGPEGRGVYSNDSSQSTVYGSVGRGSYYGNEDVRSTYTFTEVGDNGSGYYANTAFQPLGDKAREYMSQEGEGDEWH